MNRNETTYVVHSALYSTAAMMIAGSIIQSFLLESGVSAPAVSLYLSLVQVVQVSVILAVSVFIDRIRSVIRAYAYATALQSLMFFSLIFLCLFQGVTLTFRYVLVFSVGIVTNLFQAIFNVLTYKVPYHVMEMSRFGQMTGIVGVCTGICCIAVSAAMSFFLERFPYYTVMLCFLIFGVASLFASFLIILRIAETEPQNAPARLEGKKTNLLRYRPFTFLIVPNLLRGFATGIHLVAMTIGFSQGVTGTSSGAVLTLLMQTGNVLSSLAFAFLSRRVRGGYLILISSLSLILFLPSMLIGGGLSAFYLMYFFANFSFNIINNAVPVVVTKFVDYEYVGQYSSWRMLLHTAGVALSSALVTPLLGFLGGMGTLLLAAGCQAVSGVAYFLFLRKLNPPA